MVCVFSCDVPPQPFPDSTKAIGADVGLENLVTFSNGLSIPNPRFHKFAQAKLRRLQRRVSRRKQFSKRWKKAVRLVADLHRHIANQRRDYLHNLSYQMVKEFGLIAIEDLAVKRMVSGFLSKQIHDAGWATLFAMLRYKAEDAGRQVEKADSNGTSQYCICGAHVPKKLWDRQHVCSQYGRTSSRDHMSALVILQRALDALGLGQSPQDPTSVAITADVS